MTPTGLRVRPFTWDDVPVYARLVHEAGLEDGARAPYTEREAQEFLRQPNLRPERDCLLAFAGTEPAGYVLVVPELGIGRTIIEGVVHPRHRRKGAGRRLLEVALGHCQSLGARFADASTTPAGVAAQRLLTGAGFSEAARQWQMRLDLADLRWGKPVSGYTIKPMAPGEEPLMTGLQNRAFTGSWGFAPNVPEELVYRTRMGGSRPEDVLFLLTKGEPAAYCWTRVLTLDGAPVGVIWMIGADPRFRGRGFGRAMLVESINHLARQGARAIELTVYQDNTPAVELYRATGFHPVGEILWYERAVALAGDRPVAPAGDR